MQTNLRQILGLCLVSIAASSSAQQIIPITDQPTDRNTLNGISSGLANFTSASALTGVNSLLSEANAMLPLAEANVADAQHAYSTALLSGIPVDITKALGNLTAQQNTLAAYNAIKNQLEGLKAKDAATATAQTTSAGVMRDAIAAYVGGVAVSPAVESTLQKANGVAGNVNQGFQAGELAAANTSAAALTGLGLIKNNLNADGTLSAAYQTALANTVASVGTAYNNYSVGLSATTKDTIINTMTDGSWERNAIKDNTTSINQNAAAITAETTARTAADTAEASARTAADNTLQNSIATESARAKTAETALKTDITTETTRATTAETALQNNITSEATRAKAVEASLDGKISTEQLRATAAESKLTTDLASEVAKARQAESGLQDNIFAETARAQGVETTLNNKVAAEATTARAAETQLGGRITSLDNDLSAGERAINVGSVSLGGNKILSMQGNDLHIGQNSLVFSDSTGGTDYNTISTTTGDLRLQNGNVKISQAGDVIARSASVQSLAVGGRTVSGIATASGYDNTLLTTAGYVQATKTELQRGIVMTAALQTPTIDAGKNNAVKFSTAGYGGKAGFSFGFARRIWKGLSADVEAAADDSFEDGVVRGGVNYSW